MPIKQYESKRFQQESVIVNVNGESRRLIFVGGGFGKIKKFGQYTTDDSAVQQALERRSDFAQRFKIIWSQPTGQEEDNKVLEDLEELKKISPKLPIEEEKKLSESTFDEELPLVTNAQKAKEYLLKHVPGTTYSKVQNKAMILAVAEANKISFPNWTT